jgi:hypothetical protein
MTQEDNGGGHISDLIPEAIARLKDAHRLCYVDGDFIVFDTGAGVQPYEIPLAECSAYPDILGWMCHMTEKQWMTPETLARFALLACDHHGLPVSYY